MTYTLRPRHRIVTPLAHTQSLNISITNPTRYNGVKYAVGNNTVGVVSGVLFAAPMIIPAGASFDEIGVKANAEASVAARLGLYHNDEVHGGPGQLLAELGRFTTHASGFNSMAIDVVTVHETALYWLVLLAEGSVTYNSFMGGGLFTGSAGAGGVNNFMGWGYRATGQGTSLPDPVLHTDLTSWVEGPHMVVRCNNVPSMTMPVKRARRPLRHQPKEGEDQVQHIRIAAQSAPTVEVACPQDRMFLFPLTLHEPLELVSLNISIDVGNEGTGDAYVCIYESRPDNKPGRLLFADAITVDTTSTVAVLTNMTLGPGFYWVGVHQKGATGPTLSGYRALGDNLFSLNGGNYPSAAFYVDDSNATPSDPFDLSLARTDAAIAPLVTVTHKATGLTLLNNPRRFVPAWPHVYVPDFWVGPCASDWALGQDKVLFTQNSWAQLWVVDRPTTYDQVSVEFPLGGTATVNVRWGLYEDKGYRPGKLMRYLTASTGITTLSRVDTAIVGDLTLMPGIYWLAISCDDIGDNVFQGMLPAQSMDVRGGTQTPYIHFKDSFPLPTTWLATSDAAPAGPGLWMRVKNHA